MDNINIYVWNTKWIDLNRHLSIMELDGQPKPNCNDLIRKFEWCNQRASTRIYQCLLAMSDRAKILMEHVKHISGQNNLEVNWVEDIIGPFIYVCIYKIIHILSNPYIIICSVMQSDGNSLKIVSFWEAITSGIMVSS